jgi:hypothetical protein
MAFAFAFLAIGGLYGVARADCGAHPLAGRIKQFRAVEAIPLTLHNVFNNTSGWWTGTRRVDALERISGFMNCPEDPQPVKSAQGWIYNTWRRALQFQNLLAVYHFAKAGQIRDPAPCVSLYFATQRRDFLEWWSGAFAAQEPELSQALDANPYYPHVRSLGDSLMAQYGFRIPPPGANIWEEIRVLDSAREILAAHLPEGIQCRSLP